MVDPVIVGGALSALGGIFGARSAAKSAAKDRAFQKEMAQNSIQWRTQDALKAGIHPVYALGAPTMSAIPTGDGGAGQILASMGQDISRAIEAGMDRRQRNVHNKMQLQVQAQQLEMNKLQIRRQEAEIALIHSQIARNKQQAAIPRNPVSSVGQGPVGLPSPHGGAVRIEPSRVTSSRPGSPGQTAGASPAARYVRNSDFSLSLLRSDDVAESLEDDAFGGIDWFIRNRLNPWYMRSGGVAPSTSEFPVPPGYEWRWDVASQVWRPVPRSWRGTRAWTRSDYQRSMRELQEFYTERR